jgi:hypothetical protein
MVNITAIVTQSRLNALLADIPKQTRFAAALTLTMLAKDGQKVAQARIGEAFDNPTRFTRNAIAITPAKKTYLVSTVFAKDAQAEYLALEETGGGRKPEPGRPIIVPAAIKVNVHGNIPRGRIKREIAKDRTFVADGTSPKTRHLRPGIYERPKRAKRRGGGKGGVGALRQTPDGKNTGGIKGLTPLKFLASLEKAARYRPRFKFKETVNVEVENKVGARWREAVERAFASARK